MSHVLGRRGEARRPPGVRPGALPRRSREARSSAACRPRTRVWMSHGDDVRRAPAGFRVVGATETNPIAAIEDPARRLYGMQFHPEVVHTEEGTAGPRQLPRRLRLPRATGTRASFVEEATERIREQVGPKGRVICALSGGVDSAVAALLVHRAIGDRLTCVFVDNGLLRKDEATQVRRALRRAAAPQGGLRRRLEALPDEAHGRRRPRAQAQDHRPRVHRGLQGLDAPGGARREFLAQGTLYPDVIESASVRGPVGGDQEPPQRGRAARSR